MPGTPYTLEVVTPDRLVFSGEVVSLVAPGKEGYFGILSHHTPLMAALDAGLLEIEDALGVRLQVAISGGFFEVSQNHAIVLADTAETASEIDVNRAESAWKRARELLEHPTAGIDLDRARRAAHRAEARLRATRH